MKYHIDAAGKNCVCGGHLYTVGNTYQEKQGFMVLDRWFLAELKDTGAGNKT